MKKMKTPKRFRSSRLLLSLATGSLVLVLVGATVYATALPGVFTNEDNSSSLSRVLFGDLSFASGDSTDQADVAQNENGGSATGASPQTTSFTSTPTMSSLTMAAVTPVLDKVSSQVTDTSTAVENGTIQNVSPSQPGSNQSQGSSESQGSNQSQGGTIQAAAQESHFSDEAEEAFHAHMVKYYDIMMQDYEYLAEIYNYLYSSLESGETYVKPYPIDVETYIKELDGRRCTFLECYYQGERISEKSKWAVTFTEMNVTYHELVNATSALRNLNGGSSANLHKWIQYYNDHDCDHLANFQRRLPNIKL